MKEFADFKAMIDNCYNRYKSKCAITIKGEYRRNINYFNYKFDIYSLSRALKNRENLIKENKIAILSENRYEFLVTYLANALLKNTVIIIDNNLSKNAIEKIIKKQKINTIFFSNKNKDKIVEIYKLNSNTKKRNKKNIMNLIKYDQTNQFPFIEYEKLINFGRYIENYSTDNKIEQADQNDKPQKTIIVNKNFTQECSEEGILEKAYKLGKNLKMKRTRKMQNISQINTFCTMVAMIILPIMYGLNIVYGDEQECLDNIRIEQEEFNEANIEYRNNKYKIENINSQISISKIEEKNIQKIRKESSKITLVRNNKGNQNKKREEIVV